MAGLTRERHISACSTGLKGKVFLLSETFQRNHGCLFKKPGLGLLAPCQDFNIAKLCILTQLDKDSAVSMMCKLPCHGSPPPSGESLT
jgi:hypothetical protein